MAKKSKEEFISSFWKRYKRKASSFEKSLMTLYDFLFLASLLPCGNGCTKTEGSKKPHDDCCPRGKNSPRKMTHTGFAGGVFSIHVNDYPRFSEIYLELLENKKQAIREFGYAKAHPHIPRYDTLAERIVGERTCLFIDLDFVLENQMTTQQAEVEANQFLTILLKHINIMFVNPCTEYVTYFRTKDKNGNSQSKNADECEYETVDKDSDEDNYDNVDDNVDGNSENDVECITESSDTSNENRYKNGYHFIFPFLDITQDESKALRERVLSEWALIKWVHEGIRSTTGEKEYDYAVIKNGMRLSPSSKAERFMNLSTEDEMAELRRIRDDFPDYKIRGDTRYYHKYDDTLYQVILDTTAGQIGNTLISINPIYRSGNRNCTYELSDVGKNIMSEFEYRKTKSRRRNLTAAEEEWEKRNNTFDFIKTQIVNLTGYKNPKTTNHYIEESLDRRGFLKVVSKWFIEVNSSDKKCGICQKCHETPEFSVEIYERDYRISCVSRSLKINKTIYGNIKQPFYGGLVFDPIGYRYTIESFKVILGEKIKNFQDALPGFEITFPNTEILPDIEEYDPEAVGRVADFIFSDKGRGKTSRLKTFLHKASKSKSKPKICCLAGLICVAEKFSEEFGISCYRDGEDIDYDRLVISLQSLWKLPKGKVYDILVMDEVMYLLMVLASDTIKLYRIREVCKYCDLPTVSLSVRYRKTERHLFTKILPISQWGKKRSKFDTLASNYPIVQG
jgi:hypothetical protein